MRYDTHWRQARFSSGITDYQDLLEAKGIELTDPAGQKEAIAAILASQLEDPPGKRFSYSNSNYVLLAHVVERVTGKPFPTFLQQEFFTPLHLRMALSPATDVPGKAQSHTTRRTAPSLPIPPPGSSTETAPSKPPLGNSSAGPTTRSHGEDGELAAERLALSRAGPAPGSGPGRHPSMGCWCQRRVKGATWVVVSAPLMVNSRL
ncbi:serine hydrolase [Streptomyces sp. NBC_00354]|uniref:serine hydrolase domain-containing protein n=1 Tax=Streptomyces sp. NBC_00354 TaxID=2975723 RepID=UPI003FA78F73